MIAWREQLNLRGVGAAVIFCGVLISYTIQTELAQHVQQTLGYKKPYFLLYLTHSGYSLLLPLHLLVLRLLGIPIQPALSTLRAALRHQFSAPPSHIPSASSQNYTQSTTNLSTPPTRPVYSARSLSRSSLPTSQPAIARMNSQRRLLGSEERRRGKKEWKWRLGRTVACLTCLIALPALTWYSAVPLTSMTDITAIYNVFAMWAYLLSIKFLGEKATKLKLGSVMLAVTGVFVIAYGDSFLVHEGGATVMEEGMNTRFLGNMLALLGSMTYAGYEVWYKINVSLPDPPNAEALEQDPGEQDSLLSSNSSEAGDGESTIQGTDSSTIRPSSPPYPPSTTYKQADGSSISSFLPPPVAATTETFLLHSNSITTGIGICTFFFLWIPIPLLHWLGWEVFEVPPRETALAIFFVIVTGVFFNSGFMILLSLWGPVIASVGNLCTLVLVAVADTLVSGKAMSSWTLLGGGMVVGSFAMLVVGARFERA